MSTTTTPTTAVTPTQTGVRIEGEHFDPEMPSGQHVCWANRVTVKDPAGGWVTYYRTRLSENHAVTTLNRVNDHLNPAETTKLVFRLGEALLAYRIVDLSGWEPVADGTVYDQYAVLFEYPWGEQEIDVKESRRQAQSSAKHHRGLAADDTDGTAPTRVEVIGRTATFGPWVDVVSPHHLLDQETTDPDVVGDISAPYTPFPAGARILYDGQPGNVVDWDQRGDKATVDTVRYELKLDNGLHGNNVPAHEVTAADA